MDIGLKILTISIKSALFMDKGWHKAGGASPLTVACFEALAYLPAPVHRLRKLMMTP